MQGAARWVGTGAVAALLGAVLAMPAVACEPLDEGDQVVDEVGRVYRVFPSARPFQRNEVSVIQTPESASGGLQDVKFFGCADDYAYTWYKTFGGYAGFVAKDEDADLADLHESAPGISVGCTALDGPSPNFCTLFVTTRQGGSSATPKFSFSMDRPAGGAPMVCLGLSLENGSTMRLRVDSYGEHAQTVSHSSCFDTQASAAIIAEMMSGSIVQVQVKRVGESGYQTIHGDTVALREAIELSDFLQDKMIAGQ